METLRASTFVGVNAPRPGGNDSNLVHVGVQLGDESHHDLVEAEIELAGVPLHVGIPEVHFVTGRDGYASMVVNVDGEERQGSPFFD